MTWLTSLNVWVLLVLSMVVVGAISAGTYLVLHSRIGDHRERTGMAAAAYMTALGSLFAILTGFLINTEYSTLRQAQTLVGREVAASSRLAWASEGLPSVDTSLVQQRLGTYLLDSERFDWKAFGSTDPQGARRSPAFLSLQELQSVSFDIASRPYVPSATANAMEESMADLTTVRRELISIAGGTMPILLFLLSVIAGFALIINALFVALRTGGSTVYVAAGIILVVALDLALVIGISAPFRGPFIVDRGPVTAMAEEVRTGVYLPWVGPAGVLATGPDTCAESGADCVRIAPDEPVPLGALLRIGKDADATGEDALRGVRLAIDYLDGSFDGVAGRLLGHEVDLLTVDDQCSAEGGRSGAGQLLNEKSLVATIGTTCSGAAYKAAEPIMAEAGVLLISAQNTAPILTTSTDPARTYFRTAPNDLMQGSVVADFVGGELGLERVAVVVDGTVYSDELSTVFSTRMISFGQPELQTFTLRSGEDPAPVVTRIASGGFQAVYLPVNSPVCEDLLGALGANPATASLVAVTSDACTTAAVVRPAARLGAFASGPDIAALADRPFYRDEYRLAYRTIYGQAPLSVWNTSAFDAANLVFDAVQRVATVGRDGTLIIDRRQLVEAVRAVNGYRGVSNTLACTPTGDCAQSARLAIYRAPAWPVGSGAVDAVPVYAKSETLRAVKRTK